MSKLGRYRYRIVPIGSLHTGWGLIFNGEIKASPQRLRVGLPRRQAEWRQLS